MFFQNTSGRLLWILSFFGISSLQVFHNWIFFLDHNWIKPWSQGMLISPATAGRNSDYNDKVFMQAWILRKLETFYALFLRLSNILGISWNQLKSFSCSTSCDKNWEHSVKSCYQQISNLLQPVRVMFFCMQLQFR